MKREKRVVSSRNPQNGLSISVGAKCPKTAEIRSRPWVSVAVFWLSRWPCFLGMTIFPDPHSRRSFDQLGAGTPFGSPRLMGLASVRCCVTVFDLFIVPDLRPGCFAWWAFYKTRTGRRRVVDACIC